MARNRKENPEFVLRCRNTGRIFGIHKSIEELPHMEKITFAEAYPEKCMPAHIKAKVAGDEDKAPAKKAKKAPAKKAKKAPAKKAKKAEKKKGLDLSTPENEIDKDPEEELSKDELTNEINEALSQDASAGLE